MTGVFVNTVCVLAGSLLGIFFRRLFRENLRRALMGALGLCTMAIGMMNAVRAEDVLCLVLCLTLGTALGELLRIEEGVESLGRRLGERAAEGGSARFTQGFVSASVLFCVGSMTVMGCLRSGLYGDHSILFTKSIMDLVAAAALAAGFGVGVAFSAMSVLLFEGALALLARWAGSGLPDQTVAAMSTVGGVVLLGMGIHMTELDGGRLKISNMLPAVFLPLAYFPILNLIKGWLS